MSTLDEEPLCSLLERLLADADASNATLSTRFADLAPAEVSRRLKSRTEYRAVYESLNDAALAVSRNTAKLLYMLARSTSARTIVEFGTSFAISTIYLAAAVHDNGGGKVITCEFEPTKIARATGNLKAAGLAGLVEIRAGDALQTLASGLPTSIDLVLLDGAKAIYVEML
jgi:predicted O-methyltransferase YrrM